MLGKQVLITGGTGGLGHAVTRRCAELGADITLPYRHDREINRLRESLDDDLLGRLTPVKADLLKEEDILRVTGKMSRIDILIHLMGGFAMGKTTETALGDWQHQIDLNLTSAFLIIRSCLALMQKEAYGRIVTIGSKAALDAPGGMSAYAASKAGLIALTRSVAAEFKGHNITANIVLPSVIDTPANRSAMGDEDAGRWVTPQSIAKVITFLASDQAADMTGAVIPVYGRS